MIAITSWYSKYTYIYIYIKLKYIYIYIWYMCPQSCSTSSVEETKKQHHWRRRHFCSPKQTSPKFAGHSAKQSVNDMWDNHIGILTSLHPSRSQKHTYTKHWKDIAKTEVKQWVFTWKGQDPEMILLQLGAKAGSLQRSPGRGILQKGA